MGGSLYGPAAATQDSAFNSQGGAEFNFYYHPQASGSSPPSLSDARGKSVLMAWRSCGYFMESVPLRSCREETAGLADSDRAQRASSRTVCPTADCRLDPQSPTRTWRRVFLVECSS